MYFRYNRDNAGEWRWAFYAANHRCIAVSSEGYVNEQDCLNSIALVQRSAGCTVYKG